MLIILEPKDSKNNELLFAISHSLICRFVRLDDFGVYLGSAETALDGIAGSLECHRDFGWVMAIGGDSMDCAFDSGCSSSVARFDHRAHGCCRFGVGDQGAWAALDSVLRFFLPVH